MSDKEVVKAKESVCHEVMDALSQQVGRLETQTGELQSILKPVWLEREPEKSSDSKSRKERAELFDAIEQETRRLRNVSGQIDILLKEIQL